MGIINGDKTIIISKQAFADKAVDSMKVIMNKFGPTFVPIFAAMLTILTHELFEEDTLDEGQYED